MEWKFFQLWAKAGCGMYVEESKSQRDKERREENKNRWAGGKAWSERQRETES